jgi:hypothetical protein
VALYRDGLSAPLHFFPKSAWAYIRRDHSLAAARQRWQNSSNPAWGESADPAFQLALRGLAEPLDAAFEHCAQHRLRTAAGLSRGFPPMTASHPGLRPIEAIDLDVFACPLDGLRLIEASAGTGKTWNICGLYLRLLLERNLEVQQILVVTFTNAATAELRERIRCRIVDVVAYLQRGTLADPFVTRLVAAVAEECRRRSPADAGPPRRRAAHLRRSRRLHHSRLLSARAGRHAVCRQPAVSPRAAA